MNKIAILLPCHNEEATIAGVIAEARTALPAAEIIVCDNCSSDNTAAAARAVGARVIVEPLKGKGNAVRRLFADVDADIYILSDGDETYDLTRAPGFVDELCAGGYDMISVRREEGGDDPEAYRIGHRSGNRMISKLVALLFSDVVTDVLSGYRIFSRRFVKSFPTLASGFEIETEMTVHALELRMPVKELSAPYRSRPTGSESKLRTIRDGIIIVRTIFELLKEERPLFFFGWLAAAFALLSVGLAVPIVFTYMDTGLVPRIPTAVLASSIALLAFLSLFAGLLLDSVSRGRMEVRRLKYLEFGPPSA